MKDGGGLNQGCLPVCWDSLIHLLSLGILDVQLVWGEGRGHSARYVLTCALRLEADYSY